MKFVSYAQNFEDVILWRALHSTASNGFYVDVGACYPVECSVTKAFYDVGWSGINIEPNSEIYKQLCEERSRDINLNVAISDSNGTAKFFEFQDELGASTICPEIVNTHKSSSDRPVQELEVSTMTLKKVFEQYVKSQDVAFLKIDVEGLEQVVIRGMDWHQFRPWVVVVEAMKPWKQQPTHEDWEYILVKADYFFAYADGLNRFYVAQEHPELLQFFQYPPSVFDEFVTYGQQQAENKIHHTENKLHHTEKKLLEAENGLEEAKDKMVLLENTLHAVYNSLSWRITVPLRFVKSKIKQLL